MSKKEYSTEQIQELIQNKYVKDCTSKYISFTDEFKIKALELDKNGIYHRKIFKDLGFPEYVYNTKIPKNSLGNWRYKLKNIGLSGLIQNKKGRKKGEKIDISKMSKDEYIKYLEAKTAYLEELHKAAHGHYP